MQEALDETARLAQRIYPPLLEGGGLAVALRSAAVSTGVPAVVEVAPGRATRPRSRWTVCSCWLDALERAGDEARLTITVREEEATLVFEVVEDRAPPMPELDGVRDRVEALGGRLTIEPDAGGGMRVSGSLPLSG